MTAFFKNKSPSAGNPTEEQESASVQEPTPQKVVEDEPTRRAPTAPTFRYFEGVASIYDLFIRAIHFNAKQLQTAISLGGEAKYACYYEGTRSIPIIEACLIGVPTMVFALIAAGAEVNSKKRNDETARLYYRHYFHTDIS